MEHFFPGDIIKITTSMAIQDPPGAITTKLMQVQETVSKIWPLKFICVNAKHSSELH
jgi:hypothetical protein